MEEKKTAAPGDGIRSLKTTNIFRIANFELYTRPNVVIMGIGVTIMAGCMMYITYMRYKYDSLGYYAAIQQDGSEQFVKKKSRWET